MCFPLFTCFFPSIHFAVFLFVFRLLLAFGCWPLAVDSTVTDAEAQASKETNEKPELKNAGRDSEFYDDTFDPTTPEHLWPDTDEEYADLPTYANVPSFGNSWLIGFEAVSEPCTPWAAGPWFNSTANTNPETKWVVDSADEACQGLSDFRHRTETVRKVVELNKCISMDYQCQDEEAILDEATLPGSVQSGSVPPADLSKRMKKAILTGSKALQKARALMGTMSHSSRSRSRRGEQVETRAL